MGLFFQILAVIIPVAVCGMLIEQEARWKNLGLLLWMIAMEVCTVLTLYVNNLFKVIGVGVLIILAIFIFIKSIAKNKKIPLIEWLLLMITMLTMVLMSGASIAQAQYHKITMEYPVIVEDGKVTVDLSGLSDEVKENIKIYMDLDFVEYSKMSNGVYMEEVTLKYKCRFNKHPKGFICLCTEEAICDACKNE